MMKNFKLVGPRKKQKHYALQKVTAARHPILIEQQLVMGPHVSAALLVLGFGSLFSACKEIV